MAALLLKYYIHCTWLPRCCIYRTTNSVARKRRKEAAGDSSARARPWSEVPRIMPCVANDSLFLAILSLTAFSWLILTWMNAELYHQCFDFCQGHQRKNDDSWWCADLVVLSVTPPLCTSCARMTLSRSRQDFSICMGYADSGAARAAELVNNLCGCLVYVPTNAVWCSQVLVCRQNFQFASHTGCAFYYLCICQCRVRCFWRQ